jgi:hypothetical protein
VTSARRGLVTVQDFVAEHVTRLRLRRLGAAGPEGAERMTEPGTGGGRLCPHATEELYAALAGHRDDGPSSACPGCDAPTLLGCVVVTDIGDEYALRCETCGARYIVSNLAHCGRCGRLVPLDGGDSGGDGEHRLVLCAACTGRADRAGSAHPEDRAHHDEDGRTQGG